MKMQQINQRITAAHEAIGPYMVKRVALDDEITQLKERLAGNQTPLNESLLRDSLTDKTRELEFAKHTIRELRNEERNALMEKYELLEMEKQNRAHNPHDEEEHRSLQQDIIEKIATLKTLIDNGN